MKRGTPDHPKVYEFAEALGVTRVAAIGYLELLFHFTAQYAPRGNIGKFSDKRIAAALDWKKNHSRLISVLTTTGWIDRDPVERLVTHGWDHHIDRVTRQRLAREGKSPVVQNVGVTAKLCTQSETYTPPPTGATTTTTTTTPTGEATPEPPTDVPTSNGNGKHPPGEALAAHEQTPLFRGGAFAEFCNVFTGPIEAGAGQEFTRCAKTPELVSALLDNTPLWMRTKKYGDGFVGAVAFLKSMVWTQVPKKSTYQPPGRKDTTIAAAQLWLGRKYGKAE